MFGHEKPEKVLSSGCLNNFGADEAGSTTLKFSGGRLATFTTSYNTQMPNEAFIVGTKGTVKMTSPFLATTKLELPDGRIIEYPMPVSAKPTILDNSTGLSYQCMEARRCLMEGSVFEHSGYGASPINFINTLAQCIWKYSCKTYKTGTQLMVTFDVNRSVGK